MPCSWQALEVLTDTRQRRLYDEELESAARLSQAFAEQAAGSADQPQFVMSDLKCAPVLLPCTGTKCQWHMRCCSCA
jgi:hypothetical protein